MPRPTEVRRLLRVPSVQLGLMVSGTVMIGIVVHSSFLPAFLDLLAYPATVIGVIVSLRALTTLAVRPFMAPLVDRMGGRYRSFLAMLTLTALGLAGVAGGAQLAVLVVISVMIGVGVGIAQPLTLVAVVEDVPREEHGTAFGVRITANRLVQLTTPLLLGLVAQLAGYGAMFVVAGVLTVGTVATLAWTRRRFAGIDVRTA
jgi:MFS family permease